MKVGIVGSRSFPDTQYVKDFVRGILNKYPDTIIVSGEALGVDLAAKEIVKDLGLLNTNYLGFPPNIPRGTPKYQTIKMLMDRNTQIVEASDYLCAFFDENSSTRGTFDTIHKALIREIPVFVYNQNRMRIDDVRDYLYVIYRWSPH